MKKLYHQPILDRFELDNDISLILLSGAPGDPESMMLQNEFVLEDPFITDVIIGL
ncbi:MAG: hypothetical protein NTY32_05975 [Bacteroidia bacterium]|nr:hypothetical protein [Bacteroidia bacterium]